MKFKLPEKWKKVELSNIADLNKSNYNKNDKWEFVNYLDTGNITNGVIDNINFIDLKIDKLPSRARRKVFQNDVVYSTVRPIQKHLGIIKNPIENMLVSTGFTVISVDKKQSDPLYIYYYLSQNKLTQQLHSIAEQRVSTYPALNVSDMKTVNVKLPPLEEQKIIANCLSSLDSKIELNNKTNKNLEQQAQEIFKHWFVDFEFPDESGNPYKSSGGKMIESELGMIPKGWKIVKLIDEINIIYGSPFKSKQFNEEGIGYPLIRIRDLKTSNPKHYTAEEHPRREFIRIGDVLAGMDGEFMPYIWRGKTSVLNQRVCKFESLTNDEYDNLYIYLLIKPHLLHIESYKVGTTVIHLGKADLKSIDILKPSKKILNDFSKLSHSIWQSIINISKEQMNLKQLRDTLLPKLMSGEIRIPLD